MCTVSKLLSRQGMKSNYIDANATVLEALSAMECENLSYLVVMYQGKYVGIFSERDYARKVILQGRYSQSTLVKEVMSADLPVVSSNDDAEYCMMLMNAYKARYLPVFDDFEFKTVITVNDLVREALQDKALAPIVEETINNGWVGEGFSTRKFIY
ncbi:CBS domain-containing protein [Filimonas lacunae]|uniref:CBS domain-containing protein n=1 Tax=Filimonas lacunae TaxID=477680 RepID=A0A173MKC2_9BACT|nr:CBS domain-containing protein [Filimonas lacunae]BAV08092.1 CBS domain-containing protein [Filimonas lacunae]SIT09201.1 CBS domain-containing protein [Filimonas lacunae]